MICEGCKRLQVGNFGTSCTLRTRKFCGEDAVHLANRIKVRVNSITKDPFHAHLEWPVKFNPEDVVECPHHASKT